ncbi:hypothetical protein FKW77_002597 [Venturia effusa]|uniref:Methyltransferase domain-containing protein n=1 Tax=Venturia effusa TaxID=50376 RepID=A0A517LNI3_9PEZI|nr:hypothetical protein FKW77_002597 [Venturia effusa]
MGDDSYGSRLLRDKDESARLDCQHYLMTKSLGYLIHPSAAKLLVSGSKVADIATGTGVFLRDLSEKVNDASIDLQGFDISADQYPPPEKLPSNVTLKLANAKTGFPPEYHGKFDIVNIRLLTAALENEQDWRNVGLNTLALLKPGGYLQWIEGTLAQASTVLCAVPGGDPECSEVFNSGMEQLGNYNEMARTMMSWSGLNLASLLKELGAIEVRQENTSSDRCPEDRQAYTRMVVDAFRAVAGAHVGLPGTFKSMDEVLEWHAKLQELTKREKVYLRYDIHTFIARKAL